MNELREKLIRQLELLSSDDQGSHVQGLRRSWQRRFVARKTLSSVCSHAAEKSAINVVPEIPDYAKKKKIVSRLKGVEHWGAVAAVLMLVVLVRHFAHRAVSEPGGARVFQLSKPVYTSPTGLATSAKDEFKSFVISGQDEINLKSEHVSTDFSTTLVASLARVQLKEFRDGVGIHILSGELLMNFDPVSQTRRYIEIPNYGVVTITGTQVYARVTEERTEIYLRHGKASLEMVNGHTTVLRSGMYYNLRSNRSHAVSRISDAQLMRTFFPISNLSLIATSPRKEKNSAGLDFEAWRLMAIASGHGTLDSLLKEFPFVFKVFLSDGRSALVGAFEQKPETIFAHEGKVRLSVQDQGKMVRLK